MPYSITKHSIIGCARVRQENEPHQKYKYLTVHSLNINKPMYTNMVAFNKTARYCSNLWALMFIHWKLFSVIFPFLHTCSIKQQRRSVAATKFRSIGMLHMPCPSYNFRSFFPWNQHSTNLSHQLCTIYKYLWNVKHVPTLWKRERERTRENWITCGIFFVRCFFSLKNK